MNSVAYQQGKPDAFLHFYKYDAENRLTDVYTTSDSVTVEHEARYEYYKHGPLARTLIGQNQVQGLDYAYTLQGWLKAVNGTTLNPLNDMGNDGDSLVQSRQYIGRDAFGFSLHYFKDDYFPINGSALDTGVQSKLGADYKGLYNGNISSMAVNIGILNNPKLYNYQYDQLNRLTRMDAFNGTNTGINLWTGGLTSTNDYQERAAYDANGNIQTYSRNGYGSTQSMDNLTYHYTPGTNKLDYIQDGVSASNYPNDLDNQAPAHYKYDSIGNLIADSSLTMTWNVYGKLLTAGTVTYHYNAAGNRIGKTVGSTNTWYVRDAQGNILTAYSGSTMLMQERDLYGSSRLGMISTPLALTDTAVYLDHLESGTLYNFTRGQKLFELSNHLGNVLATISDKKFGTAVTGIPSQISHYSADVKSAQDYYPFGMEMPGRQYNATYPLSFNGKRDDKDANYGWQDYGMREYDKTRGQFNSIDPVNAKFPGASPYVAMDNNPILKVDPDGKDWIVSTTRNRDGSYTTRLTLIVAVQNASSNSKINMTDFANALSSQVKNSYGISYTKTEYEALTMKSGLDNYPSKTIFVPKQVKVNVMVDVQVRVIGSEKDLRSNEHLVQIQDASKLPGVYARANDIGGTKVFANENMVANMMNGKDNNTLVHELGHTFGLRHIDQKNETFFETFLWGSNPQYYDPIKQKANSNNAMFSGGSPFMNDKTSTQINGEQIEIGKQKYKSGEINNH